ncbi:MAG: hypothetical protein N4A33_12150 [Bacteriovoracaceae bacterium]|jgi:hypothetical protein|nr:hypothetical protein [Bacteriovoracaceae bacterium]
MKKTILILSLVSTFTAYSMDGVWTGDLTYVEIENGVESIYKCNSVRIEIEISNTSVVIEPQENFTSDSLKCVGSEGINYLGFKVDYEKLDNELWMYDSRMGKISKDRIHAMDRLCYWDKPCEYWDHIEVKKLNNNQLDLRVMWGPKNRGESYLYGQLVKKFNNKAKSLKFIW